MNDRHALHVLPTDRFGNADASSVQLLRSELYRVSFACAVEPVAPYSQMTSRSSTTTSGDAQYSSQLVGASIMRYTSIRLNLTFS